MALKKDNIPDISLYITIRIQLLTYQFLFFHQDIFYHNKNKNLGWGIHIWILFRKLYQIIIIKSPLKNPCFQRFLLVTLSVRNSFARVIGHRFLIISTKLIRPKKIYQKISKTKNKRI